MGLALAKINIMAFLYFPATKPRGAASNNLLWDKTRDLHSQKEHIEVRVNLKFGV